MFIAVCRCIEIAALKWQKAEEVDSSKCLNTKSIAQSLQNKLSGYLLAETTGKSSYVKFYLWLEVGTGFGAGCLV